MDGLPTVDSIQVPVLDILQAEWGCVMLLPLFLSFDAAAGDAFHKETLAENEDDQRWQNGNRRTSQNQVRAVGGAATQHVERQGQDVILHIAGVDDDQRPEEAVPGVQK